MPNRLADSLSPYLKQHADNPVDWHPWGEEALQLARRENKPILLSIGYSACHWCHVMAHESFEDEATARLMNERFVNIKVDREERPDIDQIYQSVHAMLNRRSGGWPLTVFMTPEQQPYYIGTYFPKAPRYGMPAFTQLLQGAHQAYREQGSQIAAQAEAILEALQAAMPKAASEQKAALYGDLSAAALRGLGERFDSRDGGFGAAPKFIHPMELRYCLEEGQRHLAIFTLERMAAGGIHDQLGGGFARYSVDASWIIPHFEKMLYDNGQLLGLYADACLFAETASQAAAHRATAEGIVQWLRREMQSPEGGLYAALDADSEGEEGRYYVWTREQFDSVLDARERALLMPYYGLDQAPNFEDHAWNLRIAMPLAEAAQAAAMTLAEAETALASARQKLLVARERRVHPGTDDKLLCGWNALAIAGLARAARQLQVSEWTDWACALMDCVRQRFWRDGRLHAVHKQGESRLNAYLDDHAFLLDALIELMQTRFRSEDLRFAQTLADALLDQFEDREQGGFFFTRHDHEPLLHRPKPAYDNATPSGNGVAAHALAQLGHLCAEPRYLEAAERTVKLFITQMADYPEGSCSLLRAKALLEQPPTLVVLTGPELACDAWQQSIQPDLTRKAPRALLFNLAASLSLPSGLARPVAAQPTAYVCHGMQCDPPLFDREHLRRGLGLNDSI